MRLSIAFVLLYIGSIAQPVSSTFELRYFTSDPAANGETDFKGETEWLDTEGRISFLKNYASFSSGFFDNPGLDKKIVTDEEIQHLINEIKPQPGTNIRKTIQLNGWKAYSYNEGQDVRKAKELEYWEEYPGTRISNGELVINNTTIEKNIDPLTWRFKLECKIRVAENSQCTLKLNDSDKTAVSLILNSRIQENKISKGISVISGKGSKLIVEGDLTQKRFNCYVDDKLIHNFSLMGDTSIAAISEFSISSSGGCFLDDLFIFSHTPQESANYPYISKVVLDENFEKKPDVKDWQSFHFDDSYWTDTDLPAAHGGLREKEESFYLRKKEYVGDFEKAFLQLETLDPGGEVWVNGEVVAVINNRHPHEIDVTRYLKKNQENLFAVKIKPYKLNFPMPHTPTDHYIGWFLGRTKLVFASRCMIKEVGVFTRELKEQAVQSHKVRIQYPDRNFFEGSININYYPWFPKDGGVVASHSQSVNIRPRVENDIYIEVTVPGPQLWSPEFPSLYKVEIVLKDKNGNPVDDYVITTGIRTIEQKNGDLYINGKPDMLNGAQIMGFRTPIETIAKYNRCAPVETIAEEMLMIKKMGANLLRVHVHAEKDTIDGINDPRYAEFADQMGIFLIWSTAAFIREGEAWNVDFEGYPKFMKQVINHPSIVIWEASNHPNRFKQHDISETHDFVQKIYKTIYNIDQSRLISPTSFWQHTYYANYDGTKDHQGKPVTAVPEFMADRVTRGSQDAYTGYGADWSALRKAPNDWAASCLAANDKAYFNFEHEESIGQPNWNLCKGKPWYFLPSYEWRYDEGSIGRRLATSEWRESQAWQAFSAWESMKKQILLGYDGFSWCCLRGGANMGTYQKPLIDNLRHPKLAWYTNRMVFQKTWAASNNVDVVYGPDDLITPVIHHIGDKMQVDLVIELQTLDDKTIDKKSFKNIKITEGRNSGKLEGFRFNTVEDGVYVLIYHLLDIKSKENKK